MSGDLERQEDKAALYEPTNGCDCEGFCFECKENGCVACMAETERDKEPTDG